MEEKFPIEEIETQIGTREYKTSNKKHQEYIILEYIILDNVVDLSFQSRRFCSAVINSLTMQAPWELCLLRACNFLFTLAYIFLSRLLQLFF